MLPKQVINAIPTDPCFRQLRRRADPRAREPSVEQESSRKQSIHSGGPTGNVRLCLVLFHWPQARNNRLVKLAQAPKTTICFVILNGQGMVDGPHMGIREYTYLFHRKATSLQALMHSEPCFLPDILLHACTCVRSFKHLYMFQQYCFP